jgi:DNA topoisomerase-1
MFNEITKRAVQDAFKTRSRSTEPRGRAAGAPRARPLVGYKGLAALCRTVGGAFERGRVQSVALRMVVEREREIEKVSQDRVLDGDGEPRGRFAARLRRALSEVGEQTVKTGGFDQE